MKPTTKPQTKRFKPRLVKTTKHGAIWASHLTVANDPTEKYKTRPTLKIVATKLIALLSLMGASEISEAKSILDPLSQTYVVKETDQIGGLTFKRTYSSGTAFRGHFGSGWCSELDGRILIYDGGEIRYRGCEIDTAEMVDARASAKSIRKTASGFLRFRDDGATQVFSNRGMLEKVVRTDGEIIIGRDGEMFPSELIVKSRMRMKFASLKFKIEIESRQADTAFALIREIGLQTYIYKSQLLSEQSSNGVIAARYNYDDQLNMTSRTAKGESETIEYDDLEDRVVRIARSAAFGRERLLVAIERNEKSGMIEMKIEVERGAETHPVRILYEIATHKLSLDGDRIAAQLILNWIRT